MLNVAILCPQGLGDALLMMILSYHFQKKEHSVTFYHNQIDLIKPLFPNTSFAPYPSLSNFEEIFRDYDLVIIENDHSERAWTLIRLREQKKLNNVTFLFPKPCKKISEPRDYIFNTKVPVATNLAEASQKLLQMPDATKNNGLTLLKGIKNLHKNRVAIHPTSKDPKRNWKKKQFLSLATQLKKRGFDPVFIVSVQEKVDWEDIIAQGYSLYISTSLIDLATFIYESSYLIGNDSGLGHLASNVGIPTLTISGNPKRVRLWRPDFYTNKIVTLPLDLPNFKGIGFKFRDNYWQNFISVGKVLRNFKQLTLKKVSNDT